jgi:hypothetical protein
LFWHPRHVITYLIECALFAPRSLSAVPTAGGSAISSSARAARLCAARAACRQQTQQRTAKAHRCHARAETMAGDAAAQVADAEEDTVVATLLTAVALLASVLLGRHVTQKCVSLFERRTQALVFSWPTALTARACGCAAVSGRATWSPAAAWPRCWASSSEVRPDAPLP